MQTGIQLTLIALMLALGVQDFSRRLISLWLLIVTGLALVFFGWLSVGFVELVQNSIFNLLLVTILMGGCQLYVLLKNRQWVGLFERYMGYGDLVMMLILSFGLTHTVFLLILMLSVFLGLITGLVYLLISKKQIQLPLAGILSVVTGLYILTSLGSDLGYIDLEILNTNYYIGN